MDLSTPRNGIAKASIILSQTHLRTISSFSKFGREGEATEATRTLLTRIYPREEFYSSERYLFENAAREALLFSPRTA